MSVLTSITSHVNSWSASNKEKVVVTPFMQQIYDYVKGIPSGKISTYKRVAEAIGKPCACRAVGTALKKNPYVPIVPCHRVINSDFSIGSFMGDVAAGSIKTQMLVGEGIRITNCKVLNDTEYRKSIIYTPSNTTVCTSTTTHNVISVNPLESVPNHMHDKFGPTINCQNVVLQIDD
jgi:methylated-DNA-[protein]-cysteine S-methyltransferase